MTLSINSVLMGQQQFSTGTDLRELETKLNKRFTDLFAMYPAASGDKEDIRLSVGNVNGQADPALVTQTKLNRMLTSIARQAGLPPQKIVLDSRMQSSGGFTDAAASTLNAALESLKLITPLCSSDFKNGVYAINGVSKTLAECWQENVLWAPFNAGMVAAGVGLRVQGNSSTVQQGPVATEALRSVLKPSEGFVMVVTTYASSTGTASGRCAMVSVLDLPSYSAGWDVFESQTTPPGRVEVGDYNGFTPVPVTVDSSKRHKLAAVFSHDTIGVSVAGSPVTWNGEPQEVPAGSTVGLYQRCTDGTGTFTGVIEKVEFFSLADYGLDDLQALSSPTPMVISDFKNGYYAVGGARKTLTEVWEQNLAWSSFSTSNVVPDIGLLSEATNGGSFIGPVMTTLAETGLLSGYVAVMEYTLVRGSGSVNAGVELNDLPGYANEFQFAVSSMAAGDSYALTQYGPGVTTTAPVGNKAALRLDSGSFAVSVNGAAYVENTTLPALTGMNSIALSANASTAGGLSRAIIHKVQFFALADYAKTDLPTLSIP